MELFFIHFLLLFIIMVEVVTFWVPNKVKKVNVKVFNLMSGVNETRFLAQEESCE